LVADEVNATEHCSLETIDDVDLDRPFLGQLATDDAERLKAAIAGATVVVFAKPEYHGCLASVTKPVIENLGFPSVLAGKPVGLLGLAAGRIGAIISLESLRGVCSHTGAIVLPGRVCDR
jgi:NAD(P)H-dependent FMN reductase